MTQELHLVPEKFVLLDDRAAPAADVGLPALHLDAVIHVQREPLRHISAGASQRRAAPKFPTHHQQQHVFAPEERAGFRGGNRGGARRAPVPVVVIVQADAIWGCI